MAHKTQGLFPEQPDHFMLISGAFRECALQSLTPEEITIVGGQ